MRSLLQTAIVSLALLAPTIAYAQDLPDLLNIPEVDQASSGDAVAPSAQTTEQSGPITTGTAVLDEEDTEQKKVQLPADIERTSLSIVEQITFDGDTAPAGKRPIEAQFNDPGLAGAEIREKVRVKGLLEYETGNDGNIQGSMTWYGVRNAENDEERQIGGTLESRFSTSDPEVQAGQSLSAQGDVPAALAAARALLEDGGTVPEQKSQETGRSSASGNSASQFSAGGNEPSNAMLEDFEMPEVQAAAEVPDLPDEITLSEAGCPLKVSEDGSVVQVQSQTIKNGQPQGDCAPNGTNLNVQKSYATCDDLHDLDAHKAYAQFRRFFVDLSGTTQYLDDTCVVDNDLEFTMYQDDTVCSFDLELAGANPTAFNRGKWFYQNKNNSRVEVSGCERIEGETAPIQETTSGCVPRHEFKSGTGGQSFELVRQYYVWDDVQRIVSDCSDSGKTYAHIHKTNVCSDLTPTQADMANYNDGDAALVAVAQERIAINIDGVETYISECMPIENQTANLVKDPEGCDVTFFHYLSSGESYGSTKWKYQLEGKPEITLTSCVQDNAVKYKHQTRINGYEHHDSLLYSEPKTEVYIEANGGEVMVSEAQVRDGAPHLEYVFQKSLLVATGVLFFENDTSCEQFMRQNNIDRYLKGDLVSVYDDIKGEGEALSQGDGCHVITDFVENGTSRSTGGKSYGSISKRYYEQGDDPQVDCSRPVYVASYSHLDIHASRIVMRSDGVQVGETETGSCRATNSGSYFYVTEKITRGGPSCSGSWRNNGTPRSASYPAYPTLTAAHKGACAAQLGWNYQ